MLSFSNEVDPFFSAAHIYFSNTMLTQAKGGYEYFITFIDDYSRYGYVYLMKRKSEAFEKFKEFRTEVENQLG